MTQQDDRAMVSRQAGGAIATEAPANSWEAFGLLSPYTGGLVHDAPSADWLATISAGFKNDKGNPVVSRDGRIHLSGDPSRVPGLVRALEERDYRSLTIGLLDNVPANAMQQVFKSYSRTRLLLHGDEKALTLIHQEPSGKRDSRGDPIMVGRHEVIRKEDDPERFMQLMSDVKAETSLFFALARWEDGVGGIHFPDGYKPYRLRFTSLRSAASVRATLIDIAKLTGNRVAGIPLELQIVYRDVAGPDGTRRNVPVWSLVLKHPDGLALTTGMVNRVLRAGIEQAEQLSLAPPSRESVVYAALTEGEDVDLDRARAVEGEIVPQTQPRPSRWDAPIANPDHARQEYFGAVGTTSLKTDDGRHAFVQAFTHGRYTSLPEFIAHTTAGEWSRFIAEAAERARIEVEGWQQEGATRPQVEPIAPAGRSYEDLFENDPDMATPPTPAARAPMTRETMPPEVAAAAQLTGAPPSAPNLPRPEEGKTYTRAQWAAMYVAWARRRQFLDSARVPEDVEGFKGAALVQATHQAIAEVDELESYLSEPVEDDADAEPVLVDAF